VPVDLRHVRRRDPERPEVPADVLDHPQLAARDHLLLRQQSSGYRHAVDADAEPS
jgi:hypothetical protein